MAYSSFLQLSSMNPDSIRGIGENQRKKLEKLKIYNVLDLIFHLPFRYVDKTKIVKLEHVEIGESYLMLLQVASPPQIIKGRMMKVRLQDDSNFIEATFFNAVQYFSRKFELGKKVLVYGKVGFNNYTQRKELSHPEITFLQYDEEFNLEEHLTPIYHLTASISQKIIGKFIDNAFRLLKTAPFEELLPSTCNPYNLSLTEALQICHHPLPDQMPDSNISSLAAFQRICFEEMVAYNLLLIEFKESKERLDAKAMHYDQEAQAQLLKSLPFAPTTAQNRVFAEIMTDLQRSRPMNRLVHGDVGSGKTLVAIMVLLQAAMNKVQAVLLAPTELLVQQHYHKIKEILDPFAIKVVYLSSSQKKKERQEALDALANGEALIAIGTHSLFQDEVKYQDLQLVIIDEIHRFGLSHRKSLNAKAAHAHTHQLNMTATPIPRTLQLSLYSGLDVSKLDELPKGRKPIITTVSMFTNETKQKLYHSLSNIVKTKGAQIYWVCPLIYDNEEISANSASQTYEDLVAALPDLKIGLIHGELKATAKNKVMTAFINNEINILVATTIIEVGVDVPNASVMIIDNANRLGLAQLHQLRGRVGRGGTQSYCMLLYDPSVDNPIAQERLATMKHNSDGFDIAMKDLELRGPGEILGSAQSGFDIFRVADIARDHKMIELARNNAFILKNSDRELALKLRQRWFNHSQAQRVVAHD